MRQFTVKQAVAKKILKAILWMAVLGSTSSFAVGMSQIQAGLGGTFHSVPSTAVRSTLDRQTGQMAIQEISGLATECAARRLQIAEDRRANRAALGLNGALEQN